MKPQPDSLVLDVVGGAGLQFRQRKDREYISYKLSSKVIEWKPKWFYVENQWESFPAITPGPPIQWPEWNKKLVDESQLPELLAQIADLAKECDWRNSHVRLDEKKNPAAAGSGNAWFPVSGNN